MARITSIDITIRTEIAKALGIDPLDVKVLKIVLEAGEVPMVLVEHYISESNLSALDRVLKRYRLELIDSEVIDG